MPVANRTPIATELGSYARSCLEEDSALEGVLQKCRFGKFRFGSSASKRRAENTAFESSSLQVSRWKCRFENIYLHSER
jgi:hypothetical protein